MFSGTLDSALRFGTWLTVLVQSPRLRASVARTFGVATLSVGAALLTAIGLATSTGNTLAALWSASTRTLGHGGMTAFDLAAAAFIVAGALTAAAAKSRIVAVIAMGGAGFGMAALFALFGAPDLALTQFAVEAVAVLLLVVALGALPSIVYRAKSLWQRVSELIVSIGFGLAIALVALFGMVTTADSRLAAWFAERSLTLANGRNVVNVILVDFRAFDTFGEITVLAIAGLGLAALFALPLTIRRRLGAGAQPPPTPHGRPSVIFAASAVPIMLGLVLAAIWFLIRGHNLPGGGFIAGLLAGAAVVVREMARGTSPAVLLARRRDALTIALGLAVALTAGLLGLSSGVPFLKGFWLSAALPVAGKVGTPVLFDVGVFLVVTGMSGRVYAALSRAGETAGQVSAKADSPRADSR